MRRSSTTGRCLALGALAVTGTAFYAAATGPGCTPVWETAIGTPGVDNDNVQDLRMYDGDLYAVGDFSSAGGGVPGTANIAVWNGTSWGSVGGGLAGNQFTNALEVFGGDLYVGGYFSEAGDVPGTAKLARWDGESWESVDAQLEFFTNSIWNLLTWDDGGGEDLYIAGNFTDIGGNAGLNHIVRFDGTSFSLIGGPIGTGSLPPLVVGMGAFDDGDGEDLYVSGRFVSMDGVPTSRIAKWDGTSWSEPGGGFQNATTSTAGYAMQVFEGSLYVGGQGITNAGGVPVMNIARWDGTAWHAVGDGFNNTVWNLEVFDDGSGPALYAFGVFTHSGATAVNHVARLEDGAWVPVGTGVNGTSYTALVVDEGDHQLLHIGGDYTIANGLAANRMVTIVGCPISVPCPADLTGDSAVNVFDLLDLLGAWGECGDPCPADLTGDSTVNVFDLLDLLGAWGDC